jgi:uncharacterized protein (TIGR02453 family)
VSPGGAHFSPKLFAYLRELKANNEKAWFDVNRDRYESLLVEPAIQFILDAGPHLKNVSPHFRADPRKSGGSLFRIYNDRRFKPDAPPYKTHVGIQFRHDAGKDAHAPGIYLHLEPGGCFLGVGSWRPESKSLGKIRAAIDEDPKAWKKAAHQGAFPKHFDLAGDSLKTQPRGTDPDHPMIEDLRRKDFIGVCDLTQKEVTAPDFLKTFGAKVKAGGPFLKWICEAVEVAF